MLAFEKVQLKAFNATSHVDNILNRQEELGDNLYLETKLILSLQLKDLIVNYCYLFFLLITVIV